MKRFQVQLPALWGMVCLYACLTSLWVLVLDPAYLLTADFLMVRISLVGFLLVRAYFCRSSELSLWHVLDALLVYMLLGIFYGETAHLNTLAFPKLDALFYRWDELLFGCQPALEFSQNYCSAFFSELMFMAYFSYYLMPLLALAVIWWRVRSEFIRFSSLLLSAYFIYYVIFILLPAAGPQYFFEAPLNEIQGQGMFAELVKWVQAIGEAPTAAFPSSHVGIGIILLILLYRLQSVLFYIYLPFVGMLCFSTVYIKAHYLVDVLAGFLSAPVVLWIATSFYLHWNQRKKAAEKAVV